MTFSMNPEIINELKLVAVDVDKEFVYFDKMKDGQWRMTYTKSLRPHLDVEDPE